MTNTKQIILDLDGVLVNFHRAAFNQFSVSPYLVDYPQDAGWDITTAINMLRDEKGMEPVSGRTFWNSFKKDFWANLTWMPCAVRFLELLEGLVGKENITICTSAAFDSDCAGGKVEWINRNVPSYKRQYFIGCRKWMLAKPGTILIDDADHNVKAFRDHGGKAILVPRPWNSGKCYLSAEPLQKTLNTLKWLL